MRHGRALICHDLLAFLSNPIVLLLEICHLCSLINLVFFQSGNFVLQSLDAQLSLGDAALVGFHGLIQHFQFVIKLSESCPFFF